MDNQSDQHTNQQEVERIKALYRYDILDTPAEASFDRLTRLASRLLNVPISIISLVDKDRIWFKSKYGIEVQQIDRNEGLCTCAILSDELYAIEDASVNPLTLSNPLVAGELGLKFYAALPLRTSDGFNLGTFCIIDKESRILTAEEEDLLKNLRDIAMDHIELRLASRLAIAQHNHILNTTAHDLKNPLTTIPVRADLIKLKKSDPVIVDKMCDQIIAASLNMVRIIDELLVSGTMEAGKVQLLIIKLKISTIVKNVLAMNQPLAERKNQNLVFKTETDAFISGDEGKLSEIIDNLVNNAIKYSPEHTTITVSVKENTDFILISVEDEGPGLTADDKDRLYQRFTRLSAKPTGGENSTGLGLSIVKVLVEAHNGRIWAESNGPGKGSVFNVELPLKG